MDLIIRLMGRLGFIHCFMPWGSSSDKQSKVDIGDNIAYSCMLDSGAKQFFSKTFGTPTLAGVFTVAMQVKRAAIPSSLMWLFGATPSSNTGLMFEADAKLGIYVSNTDFPSAVYQRDPTGFEQVVCSCNGVAWTVAINGVVVYTLAQGNTQVNYAGITHFIGAMDAYGGGRYCFDGYIAGVTFVDGQALPASEFGRISLSTGQWVNKTYSGLYGNNGFKLEFADAAFSTYGLGKDTSGNNNHWTPNGGITSANQYADTYQLNCSVGNPLHYVNSLPVPVWSKGNTRFTGPNGASASVGFGSIAIPQVGSWVWEIKPVGGIASSYAGICSVPIYNVVADIGYGATDYAYRLDTGAKRNNGSSVAYAAAVGVGDTLGFVFDSDAHTLTAYKNGVSLGVMFSGIPVGTYIPAFDLYNGQYWDILFGSKPLTYTYGSAKTLRSDNLQQPSIVGGKAHFDVLPYAGSSGSRTLTGLGFKPGLSWIKCRTGAFHHFITDKVRGAGKALFSSLTEAEYSWEAYFSEFTSDGFTLPTILDNTNTPGNTYTSFNWNMGDLVVPNTKGSIQSQVAANVQAGQSVVTWTHNNAASTVGHGLSKPPELIIAKCRNGGSYWPVYHKGANASPASGVLYLHSNAAWASDSSYWGGVLPTADVFTAGSYYLTLQNVAYCFHSVEGYSLVGYYFGNGSAASNFIYCGFKPRFILVKNVSGSSYDWEIIDTSRSATNPLNRRLYPSYANAENTGNDVDVCATGFNIRAPEGTDWNTAGHRYVFYAIAETSAKYAPAH